MFTLLFQVREKIFFSPKENKSFDLYRVYLLQQWFYEVFSIDHVHVNDSSIRYNK